MSILSRLFGRDERDPEREIGETYTEMLRRLCGYDFEEAGRAVREAIATCKQQGEAEGTADLPPDFGDRIIRAARMGEPKSQRIVEKARREGATEDDIREWWSLPDLSRRMVIWSENLVRLSVFRSAVEEEELSGNEAAARVHRMFPHYGDPEDTGELTGDDRPLPHELRGRVDAYRMRHGAEQIAERVRSFSSYNAFVRDAVSRDAI